MEGGGGEGLVSKTGSRGTGTVQLPRCRSHMLSFSLSVLWGQRILVCGESHVLGTIGKDTGKGSYIFCLNPSELID